MAYILVRLVKGHWLPVLASPEDCPTPVVVTVLGPKPFKERREWIRKYCEKNEITGDENLFQLRPVAVETNSLVGAGM